MPLVSCSYQLLHRLNSKTKERIALFTTGPQIMISRQEADNLRVIFYLQKKWNEKAGFTVNP
jgi:hypothetical protein